MAEVVSLAVVGHTNVGKTSLLRTLTRSTRFGEVSSRASTTRHVEGASLRVEDEEVLRLFDTPGLEDAMSLLDYLERLKRPGERPDGPELLGRFLAGPEARGQFEQEAKVLRQLLASDAGLYVIDAREPVLPKYVDELEVLAMAGRPLLAMLNFTAGPDNRAAAWREALARRGLHTLLAFDTVTPPLDGEKRLFESLALMLEGTGPALQRLIEDRQAQAAARRRSGLRLISEMLLDVAALRVVVAPEAVEAAVAATRERVRAREQACVEALLRLYSFRPEDASAGELPLTQGRWEADLYHPETLKTLGIRLGGGAAAGAAAGVGVDLMLAGVSLGAATLVGALLGSGAQAGRELGARALGRLRGERQLSVEDPILRLLALRQQQLLRALEARGHAAETPLALAAPQAEAWRRGRLPLPLERARGRPEWSSLNPGARLEAPERQAQVAALAEVLQGEG